jgi:hypothetical protein
MPPNPAPSRQLADAAGEGAPGRAEGDTPRRIDTASDGGSAAAAADSTGVVVAEGVIAAAEGAVSVIGGILGGLFEI